MQPIQYIDDKAAAMALLLGIMHRHHPDPVPRKVLEREYKQAIKEHGSIAAAADAITRGNRARKLECTSAT